MTSKRVLWGASLALKMEKVPSKRLSKKTWKKYIGKYPKIAKKWANTGHTHLSFLGTFLSIFGCWFLGVPQHPKIMLFWLLFLMTASWNSSRNIFGKAALTTNNARKVCQTPQACLLNNYFTRSALLKLEVAESLMQTWMQTWLHVNAHFNARDFAATVSGVYKSHL